MTSPDSSLNTSLEVVTAAAVAELNPVWKLKPTQIVTALKDVIPAIVDKWGLASASVAATWYDHLRETQNISGRFTAIVPPLDHLGGDALAGWATEPLRTPLRVVDPGGLQVDAPANLEPVNLDVAAAQYRAEGGLQKRLVNAANLTVTESASQDPKARGYMRRTRPGACKFCIMLASRGGVYTKASATFASHEHCYCEAVPAWGGQALPVGPYKPSDRPSTPEDRARVRKWIADNL